MILKSFSKMFSAIIFHSSNKFFWLFASYTYLYKLLWLFYSMIFQFNCIEIVFIDIKLALLRNFLNAFLFHIIIFLLFHNYFTNKYKLIYASFPHKFILEMIWNCFSSIPKTCVALQFLMLSFLSITNSLHHNYFY